MNFSGATNTKHEERVKKRYAHWGAIAHARDTVLTMPRQHDFETRSALGIPEAPRAKVKRSDPIVCVTAVSAASTLRPYIFTRSRTLASPSAPFQNQILRCLRSRTGPDDRLEA